MGDEELDVSSKSAFSGELFDLLFLTETADKQSVVFLSDDVSVKSLNDYFALLCGVDDTVVCVKQGDAVAYYAVAIKVFGGLRHERAPCTQVTPSEICRTDEDLGGFLHDGIVYGDAFAFWVAKVDGSLFLWGAKNREHVLENL